MEVRLQSDSTRGLLGKKQNKTKIQPQRNPATKTYIRLGLLPPRLVYTNLVSDPENHYR